ncbi:MAG: BRO family protein [Peptoanaerobacter stomatis]|uniref:BRO family protein n=1 Tax=Peptoanaerobacter stomatis TaxID=796937 RepID=UPI003F9F06ED
MENSLKIIDEREVLGRQFKTYCTYDNPLFLAKNVAEIIEHSNTRMMLQTIDDNEKQCVNNPYALKGQQKQWFLTEYGLYEVLMQSRKPIAKQFKKKVKEILYDVRRYGAYIEQDLLNNPEFLSQVVEKLKEEKNKRIQLQFENNSLKDTNKQLEKDNKQLTDKTREQEPLVELSKTLLKATNAIRFDEMAKMLKTNGVNIGRNRLTRFLKEQKVLTENLTPYQQYMDKEYFYVYQTIIGGKTVVGTHINPQGQLFIVKLIIGKYNK